MKKILILIFVMLFFSSLYGKENTNLKSEDKIDSIYVLQKKIYQDVKDQPLKDKKYGIEFNFLRLLFFGSDTNVFNHTLSGTFSLFYPKKKVEIAFPFFYSNPTLTSDDEYYEDNPIRQITLDCHYRKFLGNSLNKFYISGFVRYANLEGYECSDWFKGKNDDPVKSTENKIGVGIGVGYRIFSYSGFYWGTSLSLGRYIIGKNNKFGNSIWDNDSDIIFNFEFLKFGWAF